MLTIIHIDTEHYGWVVCQYDDAESERANERLDEICAEILAANPNALPSLMYTIAHSGEIWSVGQRVRYC